MKQYLLLASQAEVKYVCKRQGGCDITLRSVRVEHQMTLIVIAAHWRGAASLFREIGVAQSVLRIFSGEECQMSTTA